MYLVLGFSLLPLFLHACNPSLRFFCAQLCLLKPNIRRGQHANIGRGTCSSKQIGGNAITRMFVLALETHLTPGDTLALIVRAEYRGLTYCDFRFFTSARASSRSPSNLSTLVVKLLCSRSYRASSSLASRRLFSASSARSKAASRSALRSASFWKSKVVYQVHRSSTKARR